jgi:hypothetical protein
MPVPTAADERAPIPDVGHQSSTTNPKGRNSRLNFRTLEPM